MVFFNNPFETSESLTDLFYFYLLRSRVSVDVREIRHFHLSRAADLTARMFFKQSAAREIPQTNYVVTSISSCLSWAGMFTILNTIGDFQSWSARDSFVISTLVRPTARIASQRNPLRRLLLLPCTLDCGLQAIYTANIMRLNETLTHPRVIDCYRELQYFNTSCN